MGDFLIKKLPKISQKTTFIPSLPLTKLGYYGIFNRYLLR